MHSKPVGKRLSELRPEDTSASQTDAVGKKGAPCKKKWEAPRLTLEADMVAVTKANSGIGLDFLDEES